MKKRKEKTNYKCDECDSFEQFYRFEFQRAARPRCSRCGSTMLTRVTPPHKQYASTYKSRTKAPQAIKKMFPSEQQKLPKNETRTIGAPSRSQAPNRRIVDKPSTSPPPNTNPPDVILFADGACSGNPGPGGWSAILKHPATGKVKRISGRNLRTTNNRMELTGAIEGLRAINADRRRRVHLVSDSEYVILGMTERIEKWIAKNWKRHQSRPVLNVDLWKVLHAITKLHDVTYEWVKGHSGHQENEECDHLARQETKIAIDELKSAQAKSCMIADQGTQPLPQISPEEICHEVNCEIDEIDIVSLSHLMTQHDCIDHKTLRERMIDARNQ